MIYRYDFPAYRKSDLDGYDGGRADDRQRPNKWIKPDKYSVNMPIESYVSHFETVASYNDWTPRDKVAHLKAALTGDAAQLLWDMGDHSDLTYDALVSRLRARFGSADHRERFACQLRALRRRAGQSLQELHNEVRRLMALAYPGTAYSDLNEILARCIHSGVKRQRTGNKGERPRPSWVG